MGSWPNRKYSNSSLLDGLRKNHTQLQALSKLLCLGMHTVYSTHEADANRLQLVKIYPVSTKTNKSSLQYSKTHTTAPYLMLCWLCIIVRISVQWNRRDALLTLSLLMSYIIYMELLEKSEILTSYIYGLTFGNADSCRFLFAAQCFNTESIQKVFLCLNCV
jgi:hypothetical protein